MKDHPAPVRSRKMRIDINIGDLITSLWDHDIHPIRIEITPHAVTVFFKGEIDAENRAFQGWGSANG